MKYLLFQQNAELYEINSSIPLNKASIADYLECARENIIFIKHKNDYYLAINKFAKKEGRKKNRLFNEYYGDIIVGKKSGKKFCGV